MKAIKKIRALVALALATCLLALLPVTALAAPSPAGTEANPADAAITKVLQMPQGTASPATTFNFSSVKKSVDGSTVATDVATMPTLATVSLTYSVNETPTSTSALLGIDYVEKQTTSLLAGISGTNNWPHAGIYVYTITETSTTWSPATETMTYSPAEYDLYVYVANGVSGLFVEYVYTDVVTVDHSGQTAGTKLDPSPGTTVATYSEMAFTNTFTRKSGSDPTTDASFTVSKAVSGSFANQTKLFDFTVNITQAPLTTPTPLTYKAYVLDAANTVVTSTANYSGTILTDPTYGKYIEITAGSSEVISITHNQKIVVVEAHVGSGFAVSEAAAADYTPTLALTNNGALATTGGALNTALGTGSKLVTEGVDTAAYTNAHSATAPTGIALADLPFVGMLVLGLGAIVAFFVVRSRKHAKSAAN